MQDAIEKKIEKFSSQHVNTQKRVNTSSKFRGTGNHLMLGSLNAPGSSGNGATGAGGQSLSNGGGNSASVGRPVMPVGGVKSAPGSSGGQGHNSSNGGSNGLGPPISKKKYSISVTPGQGSTLQD